MRILLADDSEDNRFLVRGYLKDTGCVIDEVANGAEVVEKFKNGVYDLILMDAEMPVLDGYSATRAMRAHRKRARHARDAHTRFDGARSERSERPKHRSRLYGPS